MNREKLCISIKIGLSFHSLVRRLGAFNKPHPRICSTKFKQHGCINTKITLPKVMLNHQQSKGILSDYNQIFCKWPGFTNKIGACIEIGSGI